MPGKIVPIDGSEHAFIPDALPPKWEFPVRLWSLIAEAKHQIGVLDGIGRVLPDPAILQPLSDTTPKTYFSPEVFAVAYENISEPHETSS